MNPKFKSSGVDRLTKPLLFFDRSLYCISSAITTIKLQPSFVNIPPVRRTTSTSESLIYCPHILHYFERIYLTAQFNITNLLAQPCSSPPFIPIGLPATHPPSWLSQVQSATKPIYGATNSNIDHMYYQHSVNIIKSNPLSTGFRYCKSQ